MQRPVGSDVVDGRAELTSIWDLLSNRLAFWAYGHVVLVGLTTAAAVIFGVSCWHILRGRNEDLFRKAAKLALVVGVPISAVNLWWGSHLGIVITDYQPMKIAATEALWDTEQPASFSIFQIGGFTKEDQTPSFDIEIPYLLSFLATGSFNGEVQGINRCRSRRSASTGAARTTRRRWRRRTGRCGPWRTSAASSSSCSPSLRSSRGAARSSRSGGCCGRACAPFPLPYIAALAGWVLTEVGRQPWIVWGLLKTADANSPVVSSTTIWLSLGVFGAALRSADRAQLRPPAAVRAPRSA